MAEQIKGGVDQIRGFTLVDRAAGEPITGATVNYHLKALTGPNAGKWWNGSSDTWQASEQANAMSHQNDGHWMITIDGDALVAGQTLLEYAKEPGNLHVPVGRLLYVVASSLGDIGPAVWDHAVASSQSSGSFGQELHLAKAMVANKRLHTISTGVDVVKDNDGTTTLRTMTPSDGGDDTIVVTPS